MDVTKQTLARLREPFPSRAINWRVGRMNREKMVGQALPYLDARNIQSRLDDILGAENWAVEYKSSPLPNGLICRLGIKVGDAWVFKEDGAQLDDVDTQNNNEMAIKGAYTDAFKRAAVMWGIGRYLYDYKAPTVPIELRRGRPVLAQDPPVLPAHMRPADEVEPVPANGTAAPGASQTDTDLDEDEVRAPVSEPVTPVEPQEKASAQPAAQAAAATVAQPQTGTNESRSTNVSKAPQGNASRPAQPASAVSRPAPATAARSSESGRASAPETATAAATTTARPAVERPASTPQAKPQEKASTQAARPNPERAAPQSGSSAPAGDALPEGLTDEESKIVRGLLEKIARPSIPLTMLENYIQGPKVSTALSAPAKQFIKDRMARRRERDAAA